MGSECVCLQVFDDTASVKFLLSSNLKCIEGKNRIDMTNCIFRNALTCINFTTYLNYSSYIALIITGIC